MTNLSNKESGAAVKTRINEGADGVKDFVDYVGKKTFDNSSDEKTEDPDLKTKVGDGLKSFGEKTASATDVGDGLVKDAGQGVARAAEKAGDYLAPKEDDTMPKTKGTVDSAAAGIKDFADYVGIDKQDAKGDKQD